MNSSDPISNMLTTIRNNNLRGNCKVTFPYSSFKWIICQKLKKERFFSNCFIKEKEDNKREIKITIRRRLRQIKQISKPSQHIHLSAKEIKKHCWRYGVYLISTSLPTTPLLTQKEALERRRGGKVILFIN